MELYGDMTIIKERLPEVARRCRRPDAALMGEEANIILQFTTYIVFYLQSFFLRMGLEKLLAHAFLVRTTARRGLRVRLEKQLRVHREAQPGE